MSSGMVDTLETLGTALIQHGAVNDRIYLIKCGDVDPRVLLSRFDDLVAEHGYSKIFVKIPDRVEPLFAQRGFEREAIIPRYYGEAACVFMGRFYNDRERLAAKDRQEIDEIVSLAESKAGGGGESPLPHRHVIRELTVADTTALAELYSEVFASYPFPIHDSEYLAHQMGADVVYFGCFHDGRLVAASSAEMDPATLSVEMTDFATLPDHRGKSIANRLLAVMESDMRQRGIVTACTIARSHSAGMNITFSRSGYAFGGTLINNTCIAGRIESMNVWHKRL